MSDDRGFESLFEFDASKMQRPEVPKNVILMIIGAIVVLTLAWMTFYQVQPEEVGVIQRFGKFIKITEPGLHMKIPFVDVMRPVPVQRQLKQEFGFRTVESGVRSSFTAQEFQDEAMMLTGDLNVAVVEWIVQYRVSDPYQYLFRVRNVEDTFRDMNEAVMREVIGDRTVTEVLTVGRQDVETTVRDQLQALANEYESGITVDQVVLQDVNPPDPVKPSWDEVNQAQQQRDRLINEAQARYNQVIPRAAGEAQQTILQAEGYALERVNGAEGDASRFIAVYDEYRRAPDVTRQRLYLETMQRLLPRLGGKLFLDEDAEGVLPLLPLDSLQRLVPQAGAGGGTGPGGAGAPAPGSGGGEGGAPGDGSPETDSDSRPEESR